MNSLILTGPAAAGKNTIASLLAKKRDKCAIIDVDAIRWMYRHPHKAPWEGEAGKQQQKLGVENAILLAINFARHDIDTVILDVLVEETAKIYRERLPEAKIILLMPTYDEAQERFRRRQPTITQNEFQIVYQWQEALTIFDEKIDNTTLSPEEAADKLSSVWH